MAESTPRKQLGFWGYWMFGHLVFWAAPSPAIASTPICYPLEPLRDQVALCQNNALYAQAAQRCLDSVTQAIAPQRAALMTAIAASSSAAPDGQSGEINNQIAQIERARATLQNLLTQSERAQAEIVFYMQSFQWPGGYSTKEVLDQHLGKLLGGYSCYADNHAKVLETIAELGQKISNLKTSINAAEEQVSKNGQTLQNLGQGNTANSVVSAGKASMVPSGASPRALSQITGQIGHETLETQSIPRGPASTFSQTQSGSTVPMDPRNPASPLPPAGAPSIGAATAAEMKAPTVPVNGGENYLPSSASPSSGKASGESKGIALQVLLPQGSSKKRAGDSFIDNSYIAGVIADAHRRNALPETATGRAEEEKFDLLASPDRSLFERVHEALRRVREP